MASQGGGHPNFTDELQAEEESTTVTSLIGLVVRICAVPIFAILLLVSLIF